MNNDKIKKLRYIQEHLTQYKTTKNECLLMVATEKLDEIINESVYEPSILYECDKKQCDICKDYCSHTHDIKHAKNFVEYYPNRYQEKEQENVNRPQPIIIQSPTKLDADKIKEDIKDEFELFLGVALFLALAGFILGLVSVATLFGG